MKKKVKLIFDLMEQLGVSLEDLRIYDDSIEATGKFPLEIYYRDKTRSFDLEYYYDGQDKGRFAFGVIINNTVYALACFVTDIRCGDAERYCQTCMPEGIVCTLPTAEQLAVLCDNLEDYNKISEFMKYGRIGKDGSYAIAHKGNTSNWQNYYCMDSKKTFANNYCHMAVPIINL